MATVITVGSQDITDVVQFNQTEFISVVNGTPGSCKIALTDPGRILSFTIGDRILLAVDGMNVWAGYLMRIRRTYPFPDSVPSGYREFELVGSDINILFTKRWIYDKNNPTLNSPKYPAHTSDTDVFTDLFSGYIQLNGDNIDTSSLVAHVGDINEDQSAYPIVVGSQWGETMRVMSAYNAPVWYINADRKLVWADVDVESTSWILTDHKIPDATETLLFSDTFTRTASPGLGGDWVNSNDDGNYYNEAIADGSAAVLPDGYGHAYCSYRNPGLVKPEAGRMLFDIWVPSAAGQAAYYPSYGLVLDDPTAPIWTMVERQATDWLIGPFDWTTSVTPAVVALDDSTWYTVETTWDAARNCEWRIWKQGEARPSSPILSGQITVGQVNNGIPFLDFYYGAVYGSGQSAKMDNIAIYDDVVVSGDPVEDLMGVSGLTITKDATSMFNDVVFVGASPGSDTRVAVRTTDDTSVTEHGPWQSGGLIQGIYKQNTINKYADAVVNGSPANRRGHKDDKVYASCTVWENGLRAGMVVKLRSSVWDFEDNIPIRQMRVTWPVPQQPKYELLLSHEYDSLNFYDPWKVTPVGTTPPITTIPEPPPVTVIGDPGGCDETICGITDTFTRTTTDVTHTVTGYNDGGWGTSDSGLPWKMLIHQGVGGSAYVDGTTGVIHTVGDGGFYNGCSIGHEMRSTSFPTGDWDLTFDFWWGNLEGSDNRNQGMMFLDFFSSSDCSTGWIGELDFKNMNASDLNIGQGTVWFWDYANEFTWDTLWVAQTWYSCKVHYDAASQTLMARVWVEANAEPSIWHATQVLSNPAVINSIEIGYSNSWGRVGDSETDFKFDNISLPGIDRCSEYRFDNFNRTVAAGGWGTSDTGAVWTAPKASGTFVAGDFSVDGSSGVINGTSHASSYPNYGLDSIALPSSMWPEPVIRFKYTGTVTSFQFGSGETDDPFVGESVGVDVHVVSGLLRPYCSSAGSGTNDFSSVAGPAAVAGNWYLMRLQMTSTTTSCRIWPDGSPEPVDWTASDWHAVPAAWTPSYIYAQAYGGMALYLDYIDFDYDGKPCYQDCGGTFDTFNRVLADSWGTPTVGGAIWLNGGEYPGMSVSGGFGRMALDPAQFNNMIYNPGDGSSYATPFIDTFEMTASIRYETAFDSYNDTLNWAFTVQRMVSEFLNDANGWREFRISLSDYSYIQVRTSEGTVTAALPSLPAAGTAVNVRWGYSPTYNRAKVWWGGAEPTDWTVNATLSSGPTGGWTRFIAYGQADSANTLLFGPVDFDYEGKCDGPTGGAGEPVVVSGRTTETFSGGNITYQLRTTCDPGSLLVYINGLLVYGATATTSGLVTLPFTSAGGDSILVSYVVGVHGA